jgi:hypothetical protein
MVAWDNINHAGAEQAQEAVAEVEVDHIQVADKVVLQV